MSKGKGSQLLRSPTGRGLTHLTALHLTCYYSTVVTEDLAFQILHFDPSAEKDPLTLRKDVRPSAGAYGVVSVHGPYVVAARRSEERGESAVILIYDWVQDTMVSLVDNEVLELPPVSLLLRDAPADLRALL